MIIQRCSLPMQLVIAILFAMIVGPWMPLSLVRASYTFSMVFKELLGFLLPYIIFSFVVVGITSLKKNIPTILSVMLSSIFLSNAAVACITYAVARLLLPMISCRIEDGATFVQVQSIEPLWQLQVPNLIRSEHALVLAIAVGLLLSYGFLPSLNRSISRAKELLATFVNRFFIPMLPLYVLGFLLEMQYKQIFFALMRQYGATFILIVCMQVTLLILYYILAAGGSLRRAWWYIGNALPSYITAFSTMSSTATVPVSIACAQKNIDNKPLAELAMPIMANIHLTGDSIGTPLLALVTSSIFLHTIPDVATYLIFVGYFCLTMLAVSGIPGGGIIVMAPILVAQFGFNQDMIGIIMALYLLLDSFGTAANVMGDGALVIIVEKILKRLRVMHQ